MSSEHQLYICTSVSLDLGILVLYLYICSNNLIKMRNRGIGNGCTFGPPDNFIRLNSEFVSCDLGLLNLVLTG